MKTDRIYNAFTFFCFFIVSIVIFVTIDKCAEVERLRGKYKSVCEPSTLFDVLYSRKENKDYIICNDSRVLIRHHISE